MIQNAFIVAFVYWLIMAVDYLIAWQTLTRPIVVAPLTGLFLGDLHTGIIMGASLEAIFMGISAIGGSVPADATSSSILAVAFTIISGSDVETGLAIAMPIGTLMASFSSMTTPIYAALSPYWEELAASGNMRRFRLQTISFQLIFGRLAQTVVLFVAVAFGTDALTNLLASMPGFVTRGLAAASSMMTGVGYAILLSMLWSKEVGGFFFVGFVLAKYLGMDSLSIAILGAVIAITMFLNEKRYIDLKNSITKGQTVSGDEEDFF